MLVLKNVDWVEMPFKSRSSEVKDNSYFAQYFIKRVKYTEGPSTCKEVSLKSITSQNAFLGP
jgi:hypothetical protein